MTQPERDPVLWDLLVRSDEGMTRTDTYDAVMQRVLSREKAARIQALEECEALTHRYSTAQRSAACAMLLRDIRSLIDKEKA